MSNALVSKNSNYEPVKQRTKSSGSTLKPLGQSSRGVVCYYCHKPRHTCRECRKLLNRNRRFQSTHVASTSNTLEQSMCLLQMSMPSYCSLLLLPPLHLLSQVNPTHDFGATDHMTGNSSLFTTFQSRPSTSTITLANGSKSCVLGSGTINPTPLIPLTSILSLSHFSFNLISVSKLTQTLNCSISFFPNYCLFQHLLTKQVIGRG